MALKKRSYKIEKLPDDLIEAYSGFSTGYIPNNKESRMVRRWPCSNKDCNRVVTHLCHFKYKKKNGNQVSVKRHNCHEHALSFSNKYRTPLPINYSGPERKKANLAPTTLMGEIQNALKDLGIEIFGTDLNEEQLEVAAYFLSNRVLRFLK